ncbi:enhancing lycopene biosynthesis protein 2 [Balneicella halophila]|uniref:Enhancing lycopene biosynthesis protein 2 n=1 Tax=Balneicella halophila TaxID=1537566 RepID=A0A7L4UPS6_BALHA|nr:isoprenoid biosynthesis glyoxalase ElbB [Balneicella halophila]PVX51760.1 enhancing lycopene biosynthesis protein 2 [Balneicella halophila]
MKKKIAVILAGCGKADGSEIHEATLTLLAIDQQRAEYHAFAPNIDQRDVINHITGDEMPEKRNVLIEASRITRGEIKDLKEYDVKDFDALVLPGGFGAAKNLCSFAVDGENMNINEEVTKALQQTYEAKKPIGALCIAPVMVAKALKATVTLGQDDDIAKTVENWGGKHKKTTHGEIVTDEEKKIVTTPCYMLDAKISDIYEGATNLIKKVLELA